MTPLSKKMIEIVDEVMDEELEKFRNRFDEFFSNCRKIVGFEEEIKDKNKEV